MNSAQSRTAKAELDGSNEEDAPIFFPEWSTALAKEEFEANAKSRGKFATMCFLKFCKGVHRPASITLIKGYLYDLRKQGKLVMETRDALKWFVLGARKAGAAAALTEVITTAERDIGRADDVEASVSGAILRDSRERSSDRSMPSVGATDMGRVSIRRGQGGMALS